MRSLILSHLLASTAFMSEMVDTVTITTEAGPVRINASDYDPKKHKIAKEDKNELPGVEAGRFVANTEQPIPASAPVADDGNHPNMHRTNTPETNPVDGERPVALLTPREPSNGSDHGVTRQVAKIGKKFFIVDGSGNKLEGEGIDENGYSSEAEAWKVANPALTEAVPPKAD